MKKVLFLMGFIFLFPSLCLSQGKINRPIKKEPISKKEIIIQNNNFLKEENNNVYYILGTNKELKDLGILDKEILDSNILEENNKLIKYFTRADKRTLKQIITFSNRAKLWSKNDPNYYREIKDKNDQLIIEILDTDNFWRNLNYLIIQVD